MHYEGPCKADMVRVSKMGPSSPGQPPIGRRGANYHSRKIFIDTRLLAIQNFSLVSTYVHLASMMGNVLAARGCFFFWKMGCGRYGP